jgi:large subunit ribosomal protein LP1
MFGRSDLVYLSFRLIAVLQQDEKISTLVKAAGVTIEPYWPSLFAKLLQKVNINDLIGAIGSAPAAGGGGGAAAGGGGGGGDAGGADKKEEEKKEESEEEEEGEMDFDLFD